MDADNCLDCISSSALDYTLVMAVSDSTYYTILYSILARFLTSDFVSIIPQLCTICTWK